MAQDEEIEMKYFDKDLALSNFGDEVTILTA